MASFAGRGVAVILVVAHQGVEDVDSSAGECYNRSVATLVFLEVTLV
ncbi:hypothetical protein [Corynebacterium macginleyi]|nr:hypothetical protein [Corynebacterium macginleyi]MBK4164042.1 hypothetical protein [Corynebacterium macginleyi]